MSGLFRAVHSTAGPDGLRDRVTQVDRLASASAPAATISFGYDANAYVNQVTDYNGNITKYVHNARGLQTSRTDAFGTPEARTVTTAWSSGDSILN